MDDKSSPPMGRRDLFRLGIRKAAKVVVHEVEERLTAKARGWIRPPFAAPELEFLSRCTRCSDCISACPHGVLFPLDAGLGLASARTPAADLLNNPCRLCDDWPCVVACETGALRLPDGDDDARPLPRLAVASIDSSRCLPYSGPECGACADSCPVPGALLWEGPKPRIEASACTGCGLCREACITEPKSVRIETLPPPDSDR